MLTLTLSTHSEGALLHNGLYSIQHFSAMMALMTRPVMADGFAGASTEERHLQGKLLKTHDDEIHRLAPVFAYFNSANGGKLSDATCPAIVIQQSGSQE